MSRPYTQTDSPREWARKKILDLEEAVAALKTRLDEQGVIIEALKAQRPSRFLERPSGGIDWEATMTEEALIGVDLDDSFGEPLLKLSHEDAALLNRLARYPRVSKESRLADLKTAGVTALGRELGFRLIKENESRDGLTLREHTLLIRYFALLHRAKVRV